MARLVRTQVEMEGRYEERWTLVEEDAAPEYADGERAGRRRPPAPTRLGGRPPVRVGALHLGHHPAGDGACRGAAKPACQRPRRIARPRGRSGAPRRARGDRAGRHPRPRRAAGADRRAGLRGAAVAAVAADTPEPPSGRSRRWRRPGSRSRSSSTSTRASPARSFTTIRRETTRGDVDAALAAAAAVVDAEYRTPAQLAEPARDPLRRGGLGGGRPDRVVVHAGHLRRPRRARRRVRARARRRAGGV